jgi:hypothetical protein
MGRLFVSVEPDIWGMVLPVPTSTSALTEITTAIQTQTADICHNNSECINTPGSFRCTCLDGYTFDGVNCIDVQIRKDRLSALVQQDLKEME